MKKKLEYIRLLKLRITLNFLEFIRQRTKNGMLNIINVIEQPMKKKKVDMKKCQLL